MIGATLYKHVFLHEKGEPFVGGVFRETELYLHHTIRDEALRIQIVAYLLPHFFFGVFR